MGALLGIHQDLLACLVLLFLEGTLRVLLGLVDMLLVLLFLGGTLRVLLGLADMLLVRLYLVEMLLVLVDMLPDLLVEGMPLGLAEMQRVQNFQEQLVLVDSFLGHQVLAGTLLVFVVHQVAVRQWGTHWERHLDLVGILFVVLLLSLVAHLVLLADIQKLRDRNQEQLVVPDLMPPKEQVLVGNLTSVVSEELVVGSNVRQASMGLRMELLGEEDHSK